MPANLMSTIVEVGGVPLAADIALPEAANGLVLFAHGSGSSRLSPRNRFVAQVLQSHGLATVLMDLLAPDEEERDRLTGSLRFDIGLLARRVQGVLDWVAGQEGLSHLNLGLFGASTGAAAALVAAADRPGVVRAVVSRGGRPDLAAQALPRVLAPTLLIVGSADPIVAGLNRQALGLLTALPRESKQLLVIPGASHLFEEPGALEQVASYACDWFQKYLVG